MLATIRLLFIDGWVTSTPLISTSPSTSFQSVSGVGRSPQGRIERILDCGKSRRRATQDVGVKERAQTKTDVSPDKDHVAREQQQAQLHSLHDPCRPRHTLALSRGLNVSREYDLSVEMNIH